MSKLIDIPPIIEHPITLGVNLLLAAWSIWFLMHQIRLKRSIEDRPRSKIRSAPQGYVELHGKAKAFEQKPLQTPIGRHPCLWYDYLVYDYSGNKGKMRVYDKGSDCRNFLISDETGDCLLEVNSAKVYGRHETWKSGRSELPEPVRNKVPGRRKEVYVSETTIEEGDPLVATGMFQTNGVIGQPMNLTRDARELMKTWFADKDRMLAEWDVNRDGKLDTDELRKLYQHTWNEALKSFKNSKENYTVHMLGQTGDRTKPFVISAGGERELLQESKQKIVGAVIACIYFCGSFIVLAGIKILNYIYAS